MLPLIYSHFFYTCVFAGILLCWAGAEFLGPARRRGVREVQRPDKGSFSALIAAVIVGMILSLLFPLVPYTAIIWHQPLLFFLGLALVLLGIGWRWYSMKVLGEYFTGIVILHEDQQIIQGGPYKFVRHPSYSGVLLATFGIGLMMENWASLLTLNVSLLIALLYRIRVEEEALQQIQEYRQYMLRTKSRLIPYIF